MGLCGCKERYEDQFYLEQLKTGVIHWGHDSVKYKPHRFVRSHIYGYHPNSCNIPSIEKK